MRRLLWTAWLAGVLFALCVLGCLPLALMARIGIRVQSNGNLPPLRGDDTTRIAVFGDTRKGLAAFAALAERARAEGIDLAVHTGDLVGHSDAGHYDLAESWIRRGDLYVPFLVAPGDQDLEGGEGLFEDRIGPRQFAIRWGPVDILVVDNAVAPPDEGAVERLLASAKGPVLLFMHVPPHEPGAKTFTPKPAYARFLEMIRKRPVRYVFTGHAPAGTRIEDGGIVFISSGAGGDSDGRPVDPKASVTIVEVDSKSIKDRSIVIEPVIGAWADVEHLAIGHVGEIVLRRIWGPPALLLLVVALVLLFRWLRRKPPKDAVKETKKTLKFTPAKLTGDQDIVI